MFNTIEIAKKKLELSKVKWAKDEMEIKIMEKQAEIDRIKSNIEIQNQKISELENELQGV